MAIARCEKMPSDEGSVGVVWWDPHAEKDLTDLMRCSDQCFLLVGVDSISQFLIFGVHTFLLCFGCMIRKLIYIHANHSKF